MTGDTNTDSRKDQRRLIDHRDVFSELRQNWPGLSLYERFEQVIALVLTLLISLVVLAAVGGLALRVVQLIGEGFLDPANHTLFQAVFGMILTVLIALEFNHSILAVVRRRNSIVQARTVVLVALLALARKFVILDAAVTEPLTIFSLAASVLALGAVYWLVHDQDRKDETASSERH